jgi:hypothetical protein
MRVKFAGWRLDYIRESAVGPVHRRWLLLDATIVAVVSRSEAAIFRIHAPIVTTGRLSLSLT